MALTMMRVSCSMCGEAKQGIYSESQGRWLCGECLLGQLGDNRLALTVPGASGVRCEDCNESIEQGHRALCGNCIDSVHDYCHDECNNGCWECGDSPDYVLCDYHMSARDDEIRSDYQTCEDCGEAADYTLCVKCFNAYTEEGKETAVVTDEGVITFNDIEINWAN